MLLPNSVWLSGYYLLLVCFFEKIETVIYSGTGNVVQNPNKHFGRTDRDLSIHTVSFTQKGYIQFLQYFNKVPTLTEYTFCIWVNSNNLTYNQPLLSYSRHEHERLIRVWITPFGTNINLEILEVPIFTAPVNFIENRWYHVCQSWSSHHAVFELFINGKLWTNGFAPKMKGVPIKGGGDIVVGQEYTDFDKGLDDGIEGDVFGFNFVLSATSIVLKPSATAFGSNYPLRRRYDGNKVKPLQSFDEGGAFIRNLSYPSFASASREQKLPTRSAVGPFSNTLRYFSSTVNREPKTLLPAGNSYNKLWENVFNLFDAELQRAPRIQRRTGQSYVQPQNYYVRPHAVKSHRHRSGDKSLGSLLVELSFVCGYKHGAPLRGKGVLINWSLTSVRVFGGAIVKNVAPFC